MAASIPLSNPQEGPANVLQEGSDPHADGFLTWTSVKGQQGKGEGKGKDDDEGDAKGEGKRERDWIWSTEGCSRSFL